MNLIHTYIYNMHSNQAQRPTVLLSAIRGINSVHAIVVWVVAGTSIHHTPLLAACMAAKSLHTNNDGYNNSVESYTVFAHSL